MSDVFEGLVRVTKLPPQGMITLRGDLAASAVKKAAKGVAGVDMPELRGANATKDRGLLWMSPDELAVLVPHAEASRAVQTLSGDLGAVHHLVADVSEARAHFLLEGNAVREIIAKVAPVDMRASAMPVGSVRRTRFGQVAAGFWLRDERTAQVFCFRSVADYMHTLLKTVSDMNAEVGYF